MTQPTAHFLTAAASAARSQTTPVAVRRSGPRGRGAAGADTGLLGAHWPTLAAAMRRYEQNTAEVFTQEAYECVMAGLIRLDDRRRLAQRAEALKISPFDAQLLIACAIRKWALDYSYDSTPMPQAPKLSPEYRGWRQGWVRFGIFTGTAVAIDVILLWFWLGR